MVFILLMLQISRYNAIKILVKAAGNFVIKLRFRLGYLAEYI